MKRLPALHPFLFASYASLSLIAANLAESGSRGGRLVLAVVLLAGLFYVAVRLFTREWVKSGVIASIAVLLFFSYGHVLNVLASLAPDLSFEAPLLALWLLLFAGCAYLVTRRAISIAPLSAGLTVSALLLNAFPAYSILTFSGRQLSLQEAAAQYARPIALGRPAQIADPLPDIYYLVLDAYARDDVLREIYSYDNSAFLGELIDRGFQVDPHAVANYTHSELSMASSLNLRHLDDLPEFLRSSDLIADEGAIRGAAAELIQLSSLRNTLEELGYTSVSYDSGYVRTRMDRAQRFIQNPAIETVSTWQIGLEFLLLDTTMGRGLVQLLGPQLSPHTRLFEAHRQRVLFTLESLADFAEAPGDYFVFAHVISPHVPFVFDAEGNPVDSRDPYTLLDVRGGDPDNIRMYADQLHYLNGRVLAAIDAIMAASDTPPIIVLQSDHGGKVYREPDPPLEIRMRLSLPILNAIHAPGFEFYPGMTPVNTFRVLLNERFGVAMELVDDRSYLLEPAERGWDFVEVCQVYPDCVSLRSLPDG